MVKGLSIKFKSYQETIPRLLEIIRLEKELEKHGKIIIKPSLNETKEESTNISLVEEVLKYCLANKNAGAEIFIAEGADGFDTENLFDELGYRALAEKYSIGLIDLNTSEVEPTTSDEFLQFEEIKYPRVLKDSFIISLPFVSIDDELTLSASLSNMLGAFPSEFYSGFFSSKKSRIRKAPIKYSVYDIVKCKSPHFAILDLSQRGTILAGIPLEMDKQAAKVLGLDWRNVPYLKLIDGELQE